MAPVSPNIARVVVKESAYELMNIAEHQEMGGTVLAQKKLREQTNIFISLQGEELENMEQYPKGFCFRIRKRLNLKCK